MGELLQRITRTVCLLIAMLGSSQFLFAGNNTPPIALPDAPTPQVPDAGKQHAKAARVVQQTKITLPRPVPYAPLYARTIFPYERARHLTAREKFIYSARQMVEPINLLPALESSGWSQYQLSDPRYGAGYSAFGERFGAAIAREDSDRLFTDGLLPAILHEDPRYYRLGESQSNVRRTVYALEQVFVLRSDGGRRIPNYSGFLGRIMATGLSMAYYPDASKNGGVALREFGASVAGLAAFDLLREFVPREVFSKLTIFREPDSELEPAAH